jgi:hypothetical protein
LRALCTDPTATVLLLYRHPVATARSLFRQHQRFGTGGATDEFTRNYMRWLAHHEFGSDHSPFSFALPEMDTSRTPSDPNYWLDYWIAVYRYVLAHQNLRLTLVNSDALRNQPVQMLEAIFTALGVEANVAPLANLIDPLMPDGGHMGEFCPKLLQRAEATHLALLASPLNQSPRENRVKFA